MDSDEVLALDKAHVGLRASGQGSTKTNAAINIARITKKQDGHRFCGSSRKARRLDQAYMTMAGEFTNLRDRFRQLAELSSLKPFDECGARMIVIEEFARGCEPRWRPTPGRIDTS
jgi:hypothetical protein